MESCLSFYQIICRKIAWSAATMPSFSGHYYLFAPNGVKNTGNSWIFTFPSHRLPLALFPPTILSSLSSQLSTGNCFSSTFPGLPPCPAWLAQISYLLSYVTHRPHPICLSQTNIISLQIFVFHSIKNKFGQISWPNPDNNSDNTPLLSFTDWVEPCRSPPLLHVTIQVSSVVHTGSAPVRFYHLLVAFASSFPKDQPKRGHTASGDQFPKRFGAT